MPQTREHLAVLELLEVPAGVVALTKADLAGDASERGWRRPRWRTLLRRRPVRGRPGGARSAPRAAPGSTSCAPQLDARCRSRAGREPARRSPAAARRPQLHAAGHRHGRDRARCGRGPRARARRSGSSPAAGRRGCGRCRCTTSREPRPRPGQRVALNLAGVERDEVRRGDVVVAAAMQRPRAGYLLDVEVRLLAGARPLRRGARVQVHHGTRETAGAGRAARGGEAGAGAAGTRAAAARAAAGGRRRRPLRPAPARAAGHDRRRTRARPAAAQARRRGRSTSAAWARSRRGDPLEAAAARDRGGPLGGLEAAGRAAGAGARWRARGRRSPCGGAGDAGSLPPLLERARAAARCAATPGDDARPERRGARARSRSRRASGAAAVLEDAGWQRARSDAPDGGYVSAGPRPAGRSARPRLLAALDEPTALQPRAPDALAAAAGVSAARGRAGPGRAWRPSGELVRVKPGRLLPPGRARAARRAGGRRSASATARSRSRGCATGSAPAASTRRRCWSTSTQPGSRAASGTSTSCCRLREAVSAGASTNLWTPVRRGRSLNAHAPEHGPARAGVRGAGGPRASCAANSCGAARSSAPAAPPREDRARPEAPVPAAHRLDPAHGRGRHRG